MSGKHNQCLEFKEIIQTANSTLNRCDFVLFYSNCFTSHEHLHFHALKRMTTGKITNHLFVTWVSRYSSHCSGVLIHLNQNAALTPNPAENIQISLSPNSSPELQTSTSRSALLSCRKLTQHGPQLRQLCAHTPVAPLPKRPT